MASYTPNLDLLKKSPVTDGDDMFNVETMLNENWDRIDRGIGDYTTPAQKMGLTGDLSVGASLDVLANIGNVHVWRKTVVAEEEVPAGYTLGPVESNKVLAQSSSNWGNSYAAFTVASSITVDDGGNVTMNDTSGVEIWQGYFDPNKGEDNLLGKFIQFSHVSADHISSDLETGVYFIPSNATFIRDHSSAPFYTKISACQKVNAYPLTPAGTHITYLTSTNRNAYQEGTDGSEKPAGYKLGSKITGNIALTDRTNESSTIYWNYSDQVDVSDDGEVSLIAPNRVDFNATQSNAVNMAESLVGNFIMTTSSATAIKANTVYFIPDDASVAREMSGTKFVYTTAIQSVTGYPAIPAGTTIEYLGVLGEKSKIQVLSYVGTGTSGEANACSVTASFPIEVLFSLGATGIIFSDPDAPGILNGDWGTNANGVMFGKYLTTTFAEHMGFNEGTGTSLGKKSADGKTFYWYNKTFAVTNVSGRLYYFLALG